MNRIGFTVARLVVAALLVWALAQHPIGYYTVLRLATCGVCAYGFYVALKQEQIGWAFIFGAVVLLFQPLFTLRMTKQTWGYVDVTTAVVLVGSLFLFRGESRFDRRN